MGKGGKQTTEVKIPEFLEEAAEQAIQVARRQGKIGYVPYQGPTVAAFTPMQNAAFGNISGAASAFGMGGGSIGAGAGLPKPQTFAGGMQGYSPYDLFMEAWDKVDPRQKRLIEGGGRSPKPQAEQVGYHPAVANAIGKGGMSGQVRGRF